MTEEKLSITFKLFDKDGSGSIEANEIKQILGLSAKYSDKVWNEIINQIEHNKENEVTYEEFKNMMLKLKIAHWYVSIYYINFYSNNKFSYVKNNFF